MYTTTVFLSFTYNNWCAVSVKPSEMQFTSGYS